MGGTYRWQRLMGVVAGVVLGTATLVDCGSGAAGPLVLHLDAGTEGADQYRVAAVQCAQASGGRYTIDLRTHPNKNTDDMRLQLARELAAGDPGLDIMELDVIWTGEFAQAGWIAPYPPKVARQIEQGTLPVPLETGTYRGSLFAAPLGANTQLLWYRKDLIPTPPQTWDEMIQMAEGLAARGLPHYVEVQGARYEGLTVWFNTLLASGGGSIVSDTDDVQVDRGDAAHRAVGIMARLATSTTADPSLSVSQEGDGRIAMQQGRAAFEVDYPFAYAAMQETGGGTFIDSQGRPTRQDTGRRVGDVFGWAAYP
ncbi:MAG: extracellular solute-binding protein, partial [Pseudonocardiaceae bacterium]